jgi:hypothetical protein
VVAVIAVDKHVVLILRVFDKEEDRFAKNRSALMVD